MAPNKTREGYKWTTPHYNLSLTPCWKNWRPRRVDRAARELYTACERYGVSDDTITRWMRAGEFGETVNPTPRIHLVTLSGITEFDARHTGPAYAGRPAASTRRRISRADPGRI